MIASKQVLLPRISVVDDHKLLRKGLCQLISGFGDFDVFLEADNGKDLIEKLQADELPDVILMDINMPEMDGYQATSWLRENYPTIKVLALSMYDAEHSIIRMLKAGARGYILKDTDPNELTRAIQAVVTQGYYYSEMITGSLIHNINKAEEKGGNSGNLVHQLNEKEIAFLKYACTELTYKEIADRMYLSPRTIDGYRDALFQKLNLKTRVGLVLYALKNGIVNL